MKIKSFEEKESTREYLIFDEVQKLAQIECKYPVLKRAFLFSCLTGLRWSDIYKLKWSEVREEKDDNRIVFTQKKTDNIEYLYDTNSNNNKIALNEIVFIILAREVN